MSSVELPSNARLIETATSAAAVVAPVVAAVEAVAAPVAAKVESVAVAAEPAEQILQTVGQVGVTKLESVLADVGSFVPSAAGFVSKAWTFVKSHVAALVLVLAVAAGAFGGYEHVELTRVQTALTASQSAASASATELATLKAAISRTTVKAVKKVRHK